MKMGDSIRERLQMKDDPRVASAKLSDLANMDREGAKKTLFTKQMEKAYEIRIAAKCMQPCFTNMESQGMSQKESDCMTNCTAKGMETYVWFKYFNLTQQ